MLSDSFQRLEKQVFELGNHHRKYLFFISNTKDELIERLERKGVSDQVHLWKPAMNLAVEMDIIKSVSENQKEVLNFLGCYYALQFLHLNLQSLSVLNLELTSGTSRLDTYRKYMLTTGDKFQQLVGTYMEKLLDLFLPVEKRPEFVICGCGTRADQDDIDIGIIDDGSEKRRGFNHAINFLTREMLKRACPMHMYLSEHVAGESFSASIPEYEQLLKTGIHDFIIINEMLGASPIFGSQKLYKEFQRHVTHRYYYHREGNNQYHEGFLRGILGEIRSLMLQRVRKDRINPKEDALRMIKGVISVGKTVFRIPSINPWEILNILANRDAARSDVYRRMSNAMTYLEILRNLYQLFAAQEEEICFSVEGTREHLQKVALVMGYRDIGFLKAVDHILIHYYEYIDLAKSSAEVILKDVILQLKAVSSFTALFSKEHLSLASSAHLNLALEFIRAGEFFKGTRFWNDVLETLDNEDGIVIGRWVKDLWRLEPDRRSVTISRYINWGIHSPYTFISFLVILSKYQTRNGNDIPVFDVINQRFLEKFEQTEGMTLSIARIFNHYPELVNQYLMTLTEEDVRRFEGLLAQELWDEEMNELRKQLIHLCGLHYRYSRYFRRFFRRVVTKYPHYIPTLHNTWQLQQIAQGIMSNIDSHPPSEERIEKMGEYFDLEFYRLGLQTLNGYPVQSINDDFIEFSDNYMVNLFDVCKQEVDATFGRKVSTHDLMGIFATGGHARHQAFDDDYDLIVLLDSDDDDIIEYSSKILTQMNREITKRGIMPHFRFADHFGSYVTRFSQLEEYLSTPCDDASHKEMFIDQSQLLEARMVVGSHKLEQKFHNRIVNPYIFDKAEQYIQEMVAEIKSRHRDPAVRRRLGLNFKECVGGLRDIGMFLLVCKAKYRLFIPIGDELIVSLKQILPNYNKEFRVLMQSMNFLKHARYLYRLSATADDNFKSDYLGITAKAMGFVDVDGQGDELKMLNAFQNVTQEVNRIIQRLLKEIVLPIPQLNQSAKD